MERSSFFSWTWISYFFLCGSLSLVWSGMALWKVTDPNVALILLGVSSAISGFFAGRMSAYRCYGAWAAAGVMGALSIFLLLWYTPLASVASEVNHFGWRDTAKYCGGVVFLAMFFGACLGSVGREDSTNSSVGWLFGATWIALGTLFASTLLVTSLVVNPATELAFHQAWQQSSSLSEFLNHDRLVFAAALAIVGMSFLSGVISQSAAPRRMLMVSSLGAPILLFAMITMFAAWRGLLQTLWMPALFATGFAFVAAFIGASFVYIGRRRHDMF